MSPKSLLRAKEARSNISEMTEGTTFTRVYPETGTATENSENVKKLIFCSGKIYYEILKVGVDFICCHFIEYKYFLILLVTGVLFVAFSWYLSYTIVFLITEFDLLNCVN